MEQQLTSLIMPAVAMVSGLLSFMSSLWNRALVAEARTEMITIRGELLAEVAQLEIRIFNRINGSYVRIAECGLREEHVMDKLNSLSTEISHVKDQL
jgi:hypothetical protein